MSVPPEAIASLAMYPFASLRPATDELWSVIRRHLGWGPESLEWGVVTPEVWRHPSLLLAQACGWPLVTVLLESVVVVGTFDYDVPGAMQGTYCSVLIGRNDATLEGLHAQPGTLAAINGSDSLSGWVSLQCAWGAAPERLVTTGAHLESVRAVAQGLADVASIDAVSWEHIYRIEPALVENLHVIGAGPRVPCLPIVVPRCHAALVPAMRAAFAAGVSDPAARAASEVLLIRGFVPLDLADYLPLLSLLAEETNQSTA